MRWHWQNLAETRDDRTGRVIRKRSAFFEGRAWFYFPGGPRDDRTVRVEWVHGRRWSRLGIELSIGDDDGDDYKLMLAFGWVTYWLTLAGFRAFNAMRRCWSGYQHGMVLSGDHLVLTWGADTSSFPVRTGGYWSCFVSDKLLGMAKYTEGAPEPHRIVVRMPEGTYTGTCILRDDSWKRRLWFRQTIRRAHIDMDEGQQIPHPGKGENAWDCDEDATYGLTCPATDAEDAAEKLRVSVERSRLKHGGKDWRPAKAKA